MRSHAQYEQFYMKSDEIKRGKMNSSYRTELIIQSSMFTGLKQNDAKPTTDKKFISNEINLCLCNAVKNS